MRVLEVSPDVVIRVVPNLPGPTLRWADVDEKRLSPFERPAGELMKLVRQCHVERGLHHALYRQAQQAFEDGKGELRWRTSELLKMLAPRA